MAEEREPWPLLPALDELLAREGWQQAIDEVALMERRIFAETGVGEFDDIDMAQMWIGQVYEWFSAFMPDGDKHPPPFLRSRDAAALLEQALFNVIVNSLALHVWMDECGHGYHSHISWSAEAPAVQALELEESAARTRAALIAGWRLGLWPK